ncbi:MAG: ABC transporter permease [Turicibacter sp.]|nr:ABC transporter permease [Turicibacter sp.]
MNYMKRAMTSIKRKPGKSAALLVLLFVLENLIAGAISIQTAVENTQTNLMASLPTVANIRMDLMGRENYVVDNGRMPVIQPITTDLVNQLTAFPEVESYDFFWDGYIYSRQVQLVSPTPPANGFPEGVSAERFLEWSLRSQGVDIEQLSIRGVAQEVMFDVQAGLISLSSGRAVNAQELANNSLVAVVSHEFAIQNNLQVGSTFSVENTVWDRTGVGWTTEERYDDEIIHFTEEYQLEVVGIFETARDFDFTDNRLAAMAFQTVNRIYVPNGLAESWIMANFEAAQEVDTWLADATEPPANMQAFFSLTTSQAVEAFVEFGDGLLPELYYIGTLTGVFGNINSSMESMGWIAQLVLYVAVGATIIIVTLIITLFLRDRQKEIGLYLALGEKKVKIITQLLGEILSVAVVAIGLALVSGSFLSQGLSRQMLENDLLTQQAEDPSFNHVTGISFDLEVFRPAMMSIEEMLAAYDTSMTPVAIFLFLGVGLGTVLISTVVPLVYIMRLNPQKIML